MHLKEWDPDLQRKTEKVLVVQVWTDGRYGSILEKFIHDNEMKRFLENSHVNKIKRTRRQ